MQFPHQKKIVQNSLQKLYRSIKNYRKREQDSMLWSSVHLQIVITRNQFSIDVHFIENFGSGLAKHITLGLLNITLGLLNILNKLIY